MQLAFKFQTGNNGQRKMDLLNCTLPVQSVTTIATILETNGLPFLIPTNDYRGSYNCWGYVAFNYGWEEEARWLRAEEMERHLEKNTVPISKAEATFGDIVVFRYGWSDNLEHTALLTHEVDIICHKPGACDLCVDSMDRAKQMYGGTVTYVRPKSKKP